MPDIVEILRQGASDPWLYLPAALLLGALHALEPGHSKSLMAAFIIAIRGTAKDAVLLGVAAAVGHTIVVWGLAALGLTLGDALVLDRAEPWLILISGLMVVGLGARLLVTISRGGSNCGHDHGADMGDHGHDEPTKAAMMAHVGHACTGEASASEHGGHYHAAPRGSEPDHRPHDHGDDGHSHDHDHDHDHTHDHDHDHHHAHLDHTHAHDPHDEDAHAAAHAREIATKYAGRTNVTAGEIAWFGFTGGLLPCPAAVAVLLICLQLKKISLGIAMVGAFSVGLAVTLVAVGLAAAWGTRRASGMSPSFDRWTRRLPLVSGLLVTALGVATVLRGLWMLSA